MNLTKKMIKEMCGAVSFKRGDSFYRSNKVNIDSYSPYHCVATVKGTDTFHVTVDMNEKGKLLTSCSCPKLASFDRDCQHIAAVLLSILEKKQRGGKPTTSDTPATTELTEGLLKLFNGDKPQRTSGYQRYFENRQVVDVQFMCKPITQNNNKQRMSISLNVGSANVDNIRAFLEHVNDGRPYAFSSFTFDPTRHCFRKENDAVIQQLIQIMDDEKRYLEALPNPNADVDFYQNQLLIPPFAWEKLLPLLLVAPMSHQKSNNTVHKLQVASEELPLQFDFEESPGANSYQLKVKNLKQMVVMNEYQLILYGGKLFQLGKQECHRLAELKQLLASSQTDNIPIPMEQLGFFLEKIAPGLKKIGAVTLADSITKHLRKTPLKAKLYLDRVSNRLLAGVEFQYENITINPLENRELPPGAMVIRDIEKEDEILQLMDDSEFAQTDGGYYLHNEELEYEFLRYMVPKLEKLVQIYATTAVRNRIFREKNVRPQIRVKHKKERTNWLEFKFTMDGIPEEHIREVLEALEEKRKYYRLRNGSLLSLETKEFAEIQRFLHSANVKTEDLANGLDLPMSQCLQLLDTVESNRSLIGEESFRQFIEHIQKPGTLEFTVPESLDPILKNYQKTGYYWMKTLSYYGFGGILADAMGLGKTIQSIAFVLSNLAEVREQNRKVLIVCPSSLTYNWQSEIMKFAPALQTIILDGQPKERAALQQQLIGIDVIITSYPLLRKDIKWYEKQTFHTALFDEAQAFKNPVTQTARAAKRIQADYRFALTGTPVENSLEELWSIFHVVFPELFLGLQDFSHLSKANVARRIRPFMLRRLKEEVLAELPGKMEILEMVDLLSEQKQLYAAYLAKLRHDTLKHLDKETFRKNRIKILAGLTRLRQICCHPGLFVDGYKGNSAKFKQLLTMVEESKAAGRRVLIFSQFTKMLALIGQELAKKDFSYFYLDGQTPAVERLELCERFNAGDRDLFLISLKAGGTGLNLMSADTVILYDTWWNPAVEEQAADRAHRIGQRNKVQVIKLVARGTIEEKMNELQEKKRHLIEEVIESEESIISALSVEELKAILME